jgi:hypothetical protein
MTRTEIANEALERARASQALSNYPSIFEGFMAKGIPEADIKPRENVFTSHAPVHRSIQHVGCIISAPVLGGLHHHYCRV